jgi:hypothetical protein
MPARSRPTIYSNGSTTQRSNFGRCLPFPKSAPKSLTCSVESDEFEATMRATKPSSLLGHFLFVVPMLSRQARGIGAVAVALLLALVIFGAVSLAIGLADRRKPPFPMMGDRDA